MISNKREKGWRNFKGDKHPVSKSVIQFDLSGNRLLTFGSLEQASKFFHINKGNITLCCQGKRKTAGKFKWKYEFPELQKCFSTNKKGEVKSYHSVLIASKINNLNASDILDVCLGVKTCLNGLKWSF